MYVIWCSVRRVYETLEVAYCSRICSQTNLLQWRASSLETVASADLL